MRTKGIRIAIYAFVVISFALLGCQSEMVLDPTSDDIELSAEIQSPGTTRLSVSDDGNGRFTDGDHIQLHVKSATTADAEVHELTYRNGDWTPHLSWADMNGDQVSFFGSYPALRRNTGDEWIHEVSTDQRHDEDYQNSDLLHAYTRVHRKEPVRLSFVHAMSRVSVTLRSDKRFTEVELASAVVRIRSLGAVAVHPNDGTLGSASGSEKKVVFHHHEGTATFEAIVCPQQIKPEWHTESWIEIEIDGKVMTYAAPQNLKNGTPLHALESGKELSLVISLNEKAEVEEDWSDRTVWVYGIHNPDTSKWGYAYFNPKTLGLTWKKEYGWFDCNKKDPNRHRPRSVSDSEMCWAAANSNAIHWWLEQNKAYIDRYGAYKGPRKYDDFESEIFAYYKEHFTNRGDDVAATMSWFFTGRYGLQSKAGGAFFKDILGEGTIVARVIRPRPGNIKQELKKAFQSKEAIICCISLPSLNHAISVWGADFDHDGNVSALYIADNNDSDIAKQEKFHSDYLNADLVPAGLVRKNIQMRGDKVYMESSVQGSFNIEIYEFDFLDLKTDKWEEYFRRHPEL